MAKNKNNKSDNEGLEDSSSSEIDESSVENTNIDDSVFSNENVLTKELEAAIDDKKRALAEAENTRRRSIKDLEQSRKYGHLSFSREMLSVVDSLESAVKSIPKNKEDLTDELKNFILGVEMTLEQLKQVFNNHNITRIDPEGEAFDYNVHQAMFEKETNDFDPGTIVEVMQPGWTLHERLLRPAMVGVAKKKTEKD